MRNLDDWSGEGSAPAYPIYETDDSSPLQVVALVDRFPKFFGQVVLFPRQGSPGEQVAPYDIAPAESLGLDYLARTVQSRMSEVFKGRRIIRHEEGFAVPDHPHIVLFPAKRGRGVRLYEPSLFKPDDRYFSAVQRKLRIAGQEKAKIDDRLKRLAKAVIEWT